MIGCELLCERQVLLHQIDREHRCEAVRCRGRLVDGGRVARAQHARVARRCCHNVIEHLGIDALATGERNGLGDRRHADAGEQVVAELRSLALPVATDVHDARAHRGEQGLGARERPGRASDHDRQRRRAGAERAAGDGRVEDVEVAERHCEVAGEGRSRRRHVDRERSRREPLGEPAGSEHRLAHGVGRRQHRDRGLRTRRSRGGARARCRTLKRLARREVEGAYIVPRRDEMRHHQAPHAPDSDEGDRRHVGMGTNGPALYTWPGRSRPSTPASHSETAISASRSTPVSTPRPSSR